MEPPDAVGLDLDGERRLPSLSLECGGQPSVGQQRWVDPARQVREILQRLGGAVLQFCGHRSDPVRLRSGDTCEQPELDVHRHQLLLDAVVEVPLDLAALVVLRRDEPLAGRAELFDQACVAQHEARLRGEVLDQPFAGGIERVVLGHRDGECAEQLALVPDFGRGAGQRGQIVPRGGNGIRRVVAGRRRGMSSPPSRSQTVAERAPVPAARIEAILVSTSSDAYVSATRSEKSDRTSYEGGAAAVRHAVGDRPRAAPHRVERHREQRHANHDPRHAADVARVSTAR